MTLVQEYNHNGLLARAAVRQHLTAAMVAVVRSQARVPAPDSEDLRRSQKQLLFSDICTYVSAHCSEHLTAENVAAMQGYSRYHF